MKAKSWNSDLLNILIKVCEIFHELDVKVSNPEFNMALVNWYKDGNDSIGDYRDDEKINILNFYNTYENSKHPH